MIDYYYTGQIDSSTKPNLHDTNIKAILIDTRPALDSFGDIFDRFRMAGVQIASSIKAVWEKRKSEALIEQNIRDLGKTNQSVDPHIATLVLQKVETRCGSIANQLSNCRNAESCRQITNLMHICTGEIVCPLEADAFKQVIKQEYSLEDYTKAYQRMIDCTKISLNNAIGAVRPTESETIDPQKHSALIKAAISQR